MAARTAGIDRNEEITSLSPDVVLHDIVCLCETVIPWLVRLQVITSSPAVRFIV